MPPADASAGASDAVVPAQLGFLAIYSPALGTTDETVEDQIVYFSGGSSRSNEDRSSKDRSSEERNERLRQIGLAQGMVAFARSVAGADAVDTIETARARIVLHELEPGWWLLASVDLTRLPGPPGPGGAVEYSSREVKPAALLLQDLLRAHAVFLLHQQSSLAALYATQPRVRVMGVLARYWDVFLSSWSVLLHGNPVRDVLPGLRMAACGELGMGVGEEERGSGERAVLEGLVSAADGLVDLVVGKYGEAGEGADTDNTDAGTDDPWLGTGNSLGAEDGVFFLGVGALSRPSLRSLTYWLEDVYTWGPDAYGMAENPAARARTGRRRKKTSVLPSLAEEPRRATSPSHPQGKPVKALRPSGRPPGIPPPLLPPAPVTQLARRSKSVSSPVAAESDGSAGKNDGSAMDTAMSIMKLGYGTYWGLGSHDGHDGHDIRPSSPGKRRFRNTDRATGQFLVPLVEPADTDTSTSKTSATSKASVPPRSVHVDVLPSGGTDGTDKSDARPQKLRVVVYAQRPFLYAFLFAPRDTTDTADTADTADRAVQTLIGRQLSVMHKPLLGSTAYRPGQSSAAGGASAMLSATLAASPGAASRIYDLVWDPRLLTIHSTIPNIPDPLASARGVPTPAPAPAPWSRVEALNTHMQVLNVYAATRANGAELERMCKTSRGWWIVWNRLVERAPDPAGDDEKEKEEKDDDDDDDERAPSDAGSDARGDSDTRGDSGEYTVRKEIFLIRKSSDHPDNVGGASGHDGGGLGALLGGGSGLGRASSAMRAFSASAYLGLGRQSTPAGHGVSGQDATTRMDAAGAEELAAQAAERRGSTGWADGAGKLAQGIGVDTKKYIEGLLTLNR